MPDDPPPPSDASNTGHSGPAAPSTDLLKRLPILDQPRLEPAQEAPSPADAPAATAFPSPEQLAVWLPKFQVLEQIEAGRHSAVYLARQTGLDRDVMIRVMPEPPPETVPELINRLRKRARLVHPKIVAVFDFGRTAAGPLYLATEYVDGAMLNTLIAAREVTKTRAYELALDLCDALQVVHEHQTFHGALSPRTVLVTRNWEVKLTGIGMAETATGELTWLETPAGSFIEDIRALGAVIHEIFARTPPEANGRVSRNLPPSFARVLMRCLAPDAAKRFKTPSEVKTALVEALRAEKARAAAAAAKPMPQPGSSATTAAPPAKGPQPASTSAPPPPATLAGPSGLDRQPPPPRRSIARFMAWLDRLFWTTVRTALHLSIVVGSVILLAVMFLLKDHVTVHVVDDEPERKTTPDTGTYTPPSPPPAPQQPLGLGPLPPAPILTIPAKPAEPVAIAPATAATAAKGPKADLDARYLNAVQREITAALDGSKLNDMPYLKRELERIQNSLPMPPEDDPGLPARLKQLRAIYRQELAKLNAPK